LSELPRRLAATAARTLALPAAPDAEDPGLQAAALDAIDEFIASPVAHRYLAAVRALSQLSRLRRRSGGIERLARRAIDAELDQLEQSALLPQAAEGATLIEQLRALPADPRTPRRLQALAALLEAHREIALRVRAPERLRARLEMPAESPASPAVNRGRRADRRGAARTRLRA
jgi:hypothetical protein